MKNDRNMILSHRLEHGINPRKNNIIGNSRDNYRKFVNSDIFASKNLNRSQDDRFTAYNSVNPYYNIFNPKFKEMTPHTRKLKEFHNLSTADIIDQYKSLRNKDESSNRCKEFTNLKEMKIMELCPNITTDLLKKCSQNTRVKKYLNNKQESESINVKSVKKNYSNIFNDPVIRYLLKG